MAPPILPAYGRGGPPRDPRTGAVCGFLPSPSLKPRKRRNVDNLLDGSEASTLKKPKLDLSTNIIAVCVGSEKKCFNIHHTTLTKTSSFFRACLSGQWNETSTRTVNLPETDPEAFAIYASFLYTATLAIDPPDARSLITSGRFKSSSEDLDKLAKDRHVTFCQLAVLADTLVDSSLSDALVDAILRSSDELNVVPGLASTNFLWPRLPAQSAIRRLIVDLMITRVTPEHLTKHRNEYPPELFMDLAIALAEERQLGGKKSNPVTFEDRMEYYEGHRKMQDGHTAATDVWDRLAGDKYLRWCPGFKG